MSAALTFSPTTTHASGDSFSATLSEELRDAVGRFVRTVRTRSGTPHDAQVDALAELDRNGPMSAAALAEIRGVTHQSMRLVVSRLEAAGLVAREPDPSDGRGWLMTLTDAGRHAAAAHRQARSLWLAQAIHAKLSGKERETIAQAIPLLLRLIEPD
ncbi:DNA-binding MarR family transcriptional regulator [Herbaspirillum sp. Sphag1AN]|uniref:MarR family winged helix-turn-helix transcriptional regulator n=1 Tax=unclassified Herbaspirillum TaxID=2624150 RepID=UPI001612FFC6|nr:MULTISPECIES: helix-turn-helix domain-containing protein [unclassified Herbaspirillum]MBB3211967.1 DNA-binding MarR family transcriptional regulator [Herbaspirillum sp. Sphag1AN]MBB3244199.1 DNA-binding MarR family transcriptional regulator [Herbaspirillum sp. Sphag64]